MSALLPKTAKRLGVKPNSTNRNEIAESATVLSINAKTARANKKCDCIPRFENFVVSLVEKSNKAITPISTPLKTNKKSRSLYGSLPVKAMAPKNNRSMKATMGVNIRAITGDILLTKLGFSVTKKVANSGTEGKAERTK